MAMLVSLNADPAVKHGWLGNHHGGKSSAADFPARQIRVPDGTETPKQVGHSCVSSKQT